MKLYIARQYCENDFGSKREDLVEIFSSYEKAYEFLLANSYDGEDNQCFKQEITTLYLDSNRPLNMDDYQKVDGVWINSKNEKLEIEKDDFRETWTFNMSGKLLNYYSENESDKTDYIVEHKFKVGDIVKLKAFPWNKYGVTHIDTLAIVSILPEKKGVFKDEWKWDSDFLYIVYKINGHGYFEHVHTDERAMELYSGEIPKEEKFLEVYQSHLNSEISIEKEKLQKILDTKMFVRNEECFFSSYK